MKVGQIKRGRMISTEWQRLLRFVCVGILVPCILYCIGLPAHSAPYAAMVMDNRTGEVLHSRNADTRLHPASLTKMMTLYVVFDAVERGEIGLDTVVTISGKAASEEPSKLGLKRGQRIKLRYLIRAAAVRSANDAATALAEAVSGSEAEFARRMNWTARALGMTKTNFTNAHGLTEAGHLSTARDMTVLGRHLFYDHPDYYNIFKRRSTNAGIREVRNTNRKFLDAYRGADGIKTGYTRAAGFNLVASANRSQTRIIATVFGGQSVAQRNAKMAELLDLGFRRAPTQARERPPAKPDHSFMPAGKVKRTNLAVSRSPFPVPRPTAADEEKPEIMATRSDSIEQAIKIAQNEPLEQPAAASVPLRATTNPDNGTASEGFAPVVVTRNRDTGERHWGINIGQFTTRYQAERALIKTALTELGTLDDLPRTVSSSARGHDANFVGMTQQGAARACQRLKARSIDCRTLGPN